MRSARSAAPSVTSRRQIEKRLPRSCPVRSLLPCRAARRTRIRSVSICAANGSQRAGTEIHCPLIARRNPQPPRDVPQQLLARNVLFFDPEKEMLPLAARLVGGNFLDHEIFGLLFKLAACTRQVSGQEGERIKIAGPF